MKSIIIAVNGTIKEGVFIGSLSAFPDDTEVIVLSREDFDHIAGSDHVRFQLQEARAEIERLKAVTQCE